MIKEGVTYKIVSDHLGGVRQVIDAETGEVLQSLDYDAWGNVLLDTNPGFQPFGYAGGLYDRDTGLVRFGARDYDAIAGRWLSKDARRFSAQDTNLYAYAMSDPVNLSDITGKDVCSHRSDLNFRHVWISFDNEPARSYGAWPDGELYFGRQKVLKPDGNDHEMGLTTTETTCYRSTPQEDQMLEGWIHSKYHINVSEGNPRYIFGFQDCRSFVHNIMDRLQTLQGGAPLVPVGGR